MLGLIPERLREFAVFSCEEHLTIEARIIDYGNIRVVSQILFSDKRSVSFAFR